MIIQQYYVRAQNAFEELYRMINNAPESENGTKRFLNVGFYINEPMLREIYTPWRNWSAQYAEEEWRWYAKGDRSAKEIGQHAKRWLEIMDSEGNVNSNYGYIWRQQLPYILKELRTNPKSRKASIQLFNSDTIFTKDTICTYGINFKIIGGQLDMSVVMRSNDLWFGFCNDQYCFSMLQEFIAINLKVPVGKYYHFAQDLHLYPKQYDRCPS
jgi:thymidylate synthase